MKKLWLPCEALELMKVFKVNVLNVDDHRIKPLVDKKKKKRKKSWICFNANEAFN